ISMTILQLGGTVRASIPALVMNSGPFAKAILIVLLLMSVWSWAVIWNRLRTFSKVHHADRVFLESFRRLKPGADCRLVCEQHPESLLSRVALAGQRTLDQHPAESSGSVAVRSEIAQRAMDRAASEETAALERRVGFLATTGSVSPFIGLMGTVWG